MNSVNIIGRVGGEVDLRYKDRTGEVLGMLTAVTSGKPGSKGQMKWLYQCECGKIVERYPHSASATKHCGCRTTENLKNRIRHGMAATKIYSAWITMKSRCQNPKSRKYPDYGGRGITVCAKWQTFDGFFEDMGDRPDDHSLERIDNNQGYSKENCTWATRSAQQRNRRVNRLVGGRCLTAVAEESGIQPETIRSRLRAGWSEERSCSTDPRKYKNTK